MRSIHVITSDMSTNTALSSSHTHPSEAELVAAYARDGYVDGGPVLTPEQVEVLKRELDRVVAERATAGVPQPYCISAMGQAGAPIWQIVDIWLASAAFAALLRQPRIVALAKRLMGCDRLRLWHDQIQYKPANGGGVNWWHQDWPYWRVIGPADAVLTAWIALDDADADNGCMSMVPGSHRWGDQIALLHAQGGERADHDVNSFAAGLPAACGEASVRAVVRPVPAGHVHFHHAFTWHGSHANASLRPRRAIALHLMSDRAVVLTSDHRHLKSGELPAVIGAPISGVYFPECG